MPQYLILAEDFTDEQTIDRRMAVRDEHLQRMRVEKIRGTFIIGGAKLNDQGKMIGSMLLVDLPDKTAVEEWLQEDVYVTGKVWEKIDIVPFRVAGV